MGFIPLLLYVHLFACYDCYYSNKMRQDETKHICHGLHSPLLFLTFCQCYAKNYDIVIYSGTPAGIAAAVAAARTNPLLSIAIVEPSEEIGGMSGPGGIGLRDFSNTATVRSIALEWALINSAYYNVSYPVYQPDSYVGNASFYSLLGREPSIRIFKNELIARGSSFLSKAFDAGFKRHVHQRVKAQVVKNATRITSFITKNTQTQATTAWTAKQFIDAGYEGDLMIESKTSFTYGREAAATYNESLGGVTNHSNGNFPVPVSALFDNGTLLKYIAKGPPHPVGTADEHLMGFSFRLCITNNKSNQAPFLAPPNYSPEDFELMRRMFTSQSKSHIASKLPFNSLNFRSYPPGNKFDVCDNGDGTPISTDAAGLNVGYVTGTDAERQVIYDQHRYYVQGYLYFLITDPSVPKNLNQTMSSWGLCADQWPENGHYPPQMYVREGARLVGDDVYAQNDRVPSTELCRNDSVAVGSWGIDIHIMQRYSMTDGGNIVIANNEGQTAPGTGGTFEFDLPFSILLPKRTETTNLQVPVCCSVSHVTFGGIREEPTLMQLGQAAGIAAAIAIGNGNVDIQDVPIVELQAQLLKQDGIYHYPPRANCTTPPPGPPPGPGPKMQVNDVYVSKCDGSEDQQFSWHDDGAIVLNSNSSQCVGLAKNRSAAGGHGPALVVGGECLHWLLPDGVGGAKATKQGYIKSPAPIFCQDGENEMCQCVNIVYRNVSLELWECGGSNTREIWTLNNTSSLPPIAFTPENLCWTRFEGDVDQ
eukprot:m.245454 g.245454  ORF g.245454 m.245454 type:complete len:762 (-) comp26635_c0_seq16:2085-4370(-)